VPPNQQHTLKMGTNLVPETSENLQILTRLSIRKTFTEPSVCFHITTCVTVAEGAQLVKNIFLFYKA
jgi:hypothetical protein